MAAHRIKSWEAHTTIGSLSGAIPRASAVGKALPQILEDMTARFQRVGKNFSMAEVNSVTLVDTSSHHRAFTPLEFQNLLTYNRIDFKVSATAE
jgi:hypothetical protein